MRGRRQLRALALGTILAMTVAASTVHAQPVAVGQARQVVRSVYGTIDSLRRAVVLDGEVYWQELIETGDASAAKMVFLDGTTLSTGPNSQVRIDEFVYSAGGSASRVVIDIGRGVMRFVSGLSPSSAYTIRTPNAMIGVRGTDFTVFVNDRGVTRVFVKRGVVTFAGSAGNIVDVGAGQTSEIGGDGSPAISEPGPPDSETIAAATEITALLAIAGDAAPAAASSADDVAALGGRKGQAAATRAATAASATGADCGGC